MWAIEDSFEPAELVAVSSDGTERARLGVRGGLFANLDWEDLAVEVGDDGVPRSTSPTSATTWESGAAQGAGRRRTGARRDHRDCTDHHHDLPRRGRRGPPTERRGAGRAGRHDLDHRQEPRRPRALHRFEPTRADPDRGELVPVASLALTGEQVTAADLSPDGTVLAVRTDQQLLLYPVDEGQDIARALSATPCATPSIPERQGESVAVLAGATGLLTVSEDESGQPVELHLSSPRPG